MTCTRGTTNTNARGSASDRRARKLWLLSAAAGFGGDGSTVPCYRCRARLTFDALTVDRRLAGVLGGTYARANTRPACMPCNITGGNEIRELIRRAVLFVPDRLSWQAYVEAAA
jgi:hypothetical protein